MIRTILKGLLKIITVNIGVFVGAVGVFLTEYYVLYNPPDEFTVLGFYVSIILIPIQISVLTPVTWLVGRIVNLNLFSSWYECFGIGALFPILYLALLELLPDSIDLWFCLCILPLLVYLPLVYIAYLLSKLRKRGSGRVARRKQKVSPN